MAYLGTKPANQVIDSTLIADGTVTTSDIADNAITTAKIAAGAVVPADLSTGAPVWDTSGNVGIGTSSPVLPLHVHRVGVNSTLHLTTNTTGTTGNDGFSLVSQTETGDAFVIQRENANLFFRTNNADRAIITSSGNLLVGSSSSSYAFSGTSMRWIGAGGGLMLSQDTTSARNQIVFWNPNGQVGQINTTGTTTQYNTSSDYRLKENIAPMTGALAKVSALKPVTYTWKVDGSSGEGFIAHELQEVVPDCVTGEKDAVETYVDENGVEQTRPKYQGIDTSFLVATLTAALQEQQAIITELKTRIEALESK
jgi:hypothetical protein